MKQFFCSFTAQLKQFYEKNFQISGSMAMQKGFIRFSDNKLL